MYIYVYASYISNSMRCLAAVLSGEISVWYIFYCIVIREIVVAPFNELATSATRLRQKLLGTSASIG